MDSLRNVIATTDNDTLKVYLWNELSVENSNRSYYIIGEKSAYEALNLAQKINYKKGIADAYYYLGISFSRRSKYDKAVENYLKAINVYREIQNQNGVAWATMLIAVVDYYMGNLDRSIDGYTRSLSIFETTKNELGQANCLVNMASIYDVKKDYKNAVSYAEKAYQLFGPSSHGKAVAMALIANGNRDLYIQYLKEGDQAKAELYKKKAIEGYLSNLKTYSDLSMPTEKSMQYNNIYKLYFLANDLKTAKLYLDSAVATVSDINSMVSERTVNGSLYEYYAKMGDSAKALIYYLKYSAAQDSIFNNDQTERIDNMNVQMAEFEKQKEIDLLTKDKEKHGIILWGVGLLAVLAVAFSVLFFKRFKEKQKANHILADKNKIIEHKNKEITDSIHYAKRIQTTLLPSEKYLEKTIIKLKDNSK